MTSEGGAQKSASLIVSLDRLKQLLHYDPETGTFTWLIDRSNKVKAGHIAGGITNKGYNVIGLNGQLIKSSRLAWFYMTGEWPKHEVDHKDRNRWNDCWDNLQDITHIENQANRGVSSTNIIGVKGVSLRGGKYAARITRNHITTNLGTFETIEEAIKAYETACQS